MVGMMTQTKSQNVQKKYLDADELQGERRHEYPCYVTAEQMVCL